MKFLLDENLSHSHAARLRKLGHDAVTVMDLRLSGAADADVRAAAIRDRRILVTLDGDFSNVLRYPPADTPGVIRPLASAIGGEDRRRIEAHRGSPGRNGVGRQTGRRGRIPHTDSKLLTTCF